MLGVPLLREAMVIGVIIVDDRAGRPFTDKQIALLADLRRPGRHRHREVRLFQEVQARNRELTEALEQQTATSEVLGVISRSTIDLSRSRHILDNAARLCEAEIAHVSASRGRQSGRRWPRTGGLCEHTGTTSDESRDTSIGPRVVERHRSISPNLFADPEFATCTNPQAQGNSAPNSGCRCCATARQSA